MSLVVSHPVNMLIKNYLSVNCNLLSTEVETESKPTRHPRVVMSRSVDRNLVLVNLILADTILFNMVILLNMVMIA